MDKLDRTFKAAIFDMDGLILDSERTVLSIWEQIGAKYGFDGIRDYGISVIGKNKKATVDEFRRRYGEPGEPYERELRAIYNNLAAQGMVPLKPHTIELLTAMKNAGMKTAIASSSTREEVTSQMEVLGALPFFDACICGVGLEDSFNGVRSCRASGLYTIMVPDIIQPDDEMKSLADVILPSLKDVQDFLNLK